MARSAIRARAVAARIVPAAVSTSRWSLQNPAATGTIPAGMANEGRELKAVLLDGMGTLLRLRPPVPELAVRLGVDQATADHAFRAEVAYYLEHQIEASDTSRLEDLRMRCAAVIAQVADVDHNDARAALMDSLHFEAFDDALPALAELRARGLRLVVVSNWDCSLKGVLADVGLADAVDHVVASAVAGFQKPDPRIFELALAAAGCGAAEAVHIGASAEA